MQKTKTATQTVEISDVMRDYLSEIYRISHGQIWVSTTAIAERLNVSGPATVRMMRRLEKRGLVEHQRYKGVTLTEQGKREALLGIRRHRLVERFLVDVMKFGWHEVHNKADVLQKGIDQLLEDRIAELTGHPQTCPHGEPIPTKAGLMPEKHDRPMAVIPAGTSARISRVRTHEADRLQYLGQIGLKPGATFQLLSRAPFNGPLRLKMGDHEQVIGAELAAALWVEVNQD